MCNNQGVHFCISLWKDYFLTYILIYLTSDMWVYFLVYFTLCLISFCLKYIGSCRYSCSFPFTLSHLTLSILMLSQILGTKRNGTTMWVQKFVLCYFPLYIPRFLKMIVRAWPSEFLLCRGRNFYFIGFLFYIPCCLEIKRHVLIFLFLS